MRPEERDELRGIEQRIKTLENYESLGTQPAIKDFVQWARTEISSGMERLSTDRALLADGHAHERLAILDRKDMLLYLIGLFSPSEELKALEKEMAKRSDMFEEYQSGRA